MAEPRLAPNLVNAIRDMLRTMRKSCDPYRPELHYMRGPGPKWQARHEDGAMTATAQHPAMAQLTGPSRG